MGIIRYAWVDVLDVVLLLAYAKSGPFLMYDSIRSIDANPTCVQTIPRIFSSEYLGSMRPDTFEKRTIACEMMADWQ
jgi:hypothetical protein